MKTFRCFSFGLLLAVCSGSSALADVTIPGYSGFVRLGLPGNSDSILSASFARPAAATGLVLSTSGSQINFQGAPGWSANQFVFSQGTQNDTYYLLVGSGAKEGRIFPITGNGSTSISVDLDGDTLAAIAVNDRLSIVPYWTLSTFFQGGTAIHPSPTPGNRSTEVLFPNFNATGINQSASRIFYFYNQTWLEVGQGLNPKPYEIIPPDSYVTVRHNVSSSTEWLSSGEVVSSKLLASLGVNTSSKRDNSLGLQRPTNVTLGASGLVASGAFVSSATPGNRTDELLTFNNATVSKNKSAAAIYYYWNNAWRKVGAGSANFDATEVFTPGTGFIIRKNPADVSPDWSNSPGY